MLRLGRVGETQGSFRWVPARGMPGCPAVPGPKCICPVNSHPSSRSVNQVNLIIITGPIVRPTSQIEEQGPDARPGRWAGFRAGRAMDPG